MPLLRGAGSLEERLGGFPRVFARWKSIVKFAIEASLVLAEGLVAVSGNGIERLNPARAVAHGIAEFGETIVGRIRVQARLLIGELRRMPRDQSAQVPAEPRPPIIWSQIHQGEDKHEAEKIEGNWKGNRPPGTLHKRKSTLAKIGAFQMPHMAHEWCDAGEQEWCNPEGEVLSADKHRFGKIALGLLLKRISTPFSLDFCNGSLSVFGEPVMEAPRYRCRGCVGRLVAGNPAKILKE